VGSVADQQRSGQSDLVRNGAPAERCGFLLLLSKFIFVKAGSAQSLRFDHAPD